MKKENKDHGNRNLFIILGVVFGVIILISLIIWANRPYITNNPNPQSDENKKSCQDVQVPYEDTETYIEQEPYQDTETYNDYLYLQSTYGVNQQKIGDIMGTGCYQQAQIGIKNLDTQGGWVTVTVNWETLSRQFEDTVRHFISPDQTVEFISEFDVDCDEDNKFTYNYISDPIQKTRFVTRYQDVTKTRTVTKYRTEQQCN